MDDVEVDTDVLQDRLVGTDDVLLRGIVAEDGERQPKPLSTFDADTVAPDNPTGLVEKLFRLLRVVVDDAGDVVGISGLEWIQQKRSCLLYTSPSPRD